MKGWKQIFQANRQEKKKKKGQDTNTPIGQNRLQKRAIKIDPESHFIILKGRIHQEDIKIVNIYPPNIGVLKYIRKSLEYFKKDIDGNTLIVGDIFFFLYLF